MKTTELKLFMQTKTIMLNTQSIT